MSEYFTRSGDDGSTGLLGEERVPKSHIRPSAYGALDEASSALGLARAHAMSPDTNNLIVEIQRDLYKIMAEVAATPAHASNFRSIDAERISWLESQIEGVGQKINMPAGFVIPGDTVSGAALDLARTVIRRSERLVVQLAQQDVLGNDAILPYLNRLSSLCFVLELWEYAQSGKDQPTPAKPADS